MNFTRINDKLSVTGQLSPEDLSKAAAQGFAAVVNNRPYGEDAFQPTAEQMDAAARREGLGYVHIPVKGPDISEDAVRRFQDALSSSDGPVVAHCRTGTRSLLLWAIGEVLDGRMTPEEANELGAHHGFDLSGVRAWHQARR
jgi:uncharacterized protein (TIGR01244 family)